MRRRIWALALLGSTALVPVEAFAEPISLAIATTAVAAGSAAAAGTTFAFFGLTGIGAIAASVAVRAALGFAMNALLAKGGKVRGSFTANELGPALARAIIYGETRVGGAIFYQTTTGNNNKYFHRLIAFAGHEIDSFQTIYCDDDELTIDGSGNVTAPSQYVGKLRILQHLGTDDQEADATLVSEVTEWTSAHQARGVAYLYCRFEASSSAFPNGLPKITAKIRGRKVYDPRDATTAYSTNPALCLRDYILADFGLNEASTEIDDTLFSAAADVCDEDVGSGVSRYTCNGSFLLDASPEDVVRNLLSSMGGTMWYANGAWACQAAEYVAPTVTLDEHDLRSEISISTRHSRRENYNAIKGVYRGADTDYQETDYRAIESATYLAEDNSQKATTDLPLLFTDSEPAARRIAGIALERNRRQITVTANFGLNAMQLRVGDTVKFTNTRAGWAEKVFEVVDWKFTVIEGLDIQIGMILREMDEGVFDRVAGYGDAAAPLATSSGSGTVAEPP